MTCVCILQHNKKKHGQKEWKPDQHTRPNVVPNPHSKKALWTVGIEPKQVHAIGLGLGSR